jgi:hypothetical protein
LNDPLGVGILLCKPSPSANLAHLHFWNGLKGRAGRGERIWVENGVAIGGLGEGR